MGGSYSRVPNGDILCSTFVKLDPAAEGRVLQAGLNDKIFGISQPDSRRIAMVPYDTTLCGIAGDPAINIYGENDPGVLLCLGGTVVHGDWLKSDASGKGIAANTDKDNVGARALANGTSGKLIPVEVLIFERSSV